MKNFDMTRFGRVLKLDFVEGYKPMLWGALCMMLLYLFFFWFAHNIGMHESIYDAPQDVTMLRVRTICEAVGAFSLMACFIFFLISASTLFRGEQKKQKRIAWLMLPASNQEKFLSRWIYLVAFSLVGGLLPFFVADGVHIAYLWMTDNPVMCTTKWFFNMMPHVSDYGGVTINDWLSTIMEYSFVIGIHSFYLLGGVFFKKFHFIAASAVVVIAFAAFVACINMFTDPGQPSDISHTAYYITVTVFWTLAVILFTWLAYYLFCRWQVVTHKFANI